MDPGHGDRGMRPRSGSEARRRARPGARGNASPTAAATAARPTVQKITLAAKALFDFDKAVLKPEGKAAIDNEVIAKLKDVAKLELVLVTGHTDRIGSQAYNQKLSERRANAVRDYLVSKGVARDKIETLGMGKTQPVPGVVCNQVSEGTQGTDRMPCAQSARRCRSEGRGGQALSLPRSLEKPRLCAGLFSIQRRHTIRSRRGAVPSAPSAFRR